MPLTLMMARAIGEGAAYAVGPDLGLTTFPTLY